MHESSEEGEAGVSREMPKYVSHKTIWALEISSVTHRTDGSGDWNIEFADEGYAAMKAPAEMFSRYKPVAGDYYVQYVDGYKSFSPRKAFLEGYTKV